MTAAIPTSFDSPGREDYSWAQHLHWMEGGMDFTLSEPMAPAKEEAKTGKTTVYAGLALTAGVAVISLLLSKAPVWPFTTGSGRHPLDAVLLAIIFGMLVGNIWILPASMRTGVKFSVKKLLPLGVIFLGARLDFQDLISVGATGILLSTLEVFFALGLFIFLTVKFCLPKRLGLLLGVGTAICGGSAIVAVAPVIKAKEDEVVISVATVTLLGLIAMITMPIIGRFMEMGPEAFGIWTGLTIHQMAQVIAAGFAHSPEAGDTATIIKLARVGLLAPVVFLIGIYWGWKGEERNTEKVGWKRYVSMFPTFVLGFLVLALFNTLGFFPEVGLQWSSTALADHPETVFSLQRFTVQAATFCLAASMAGVGLETRFSALARTSSKPLIAAALGAVIIALAGLGAALLVT